MGLAAAGTVAVAVLVAITLLPALLGFAGLTDPAPQARSGAWRRGPHKEGFGFRWARMVTRLRVPVILVGILGLGALALPAADMRLALPDAGVRSPRARPPARPPT